MGLLTLMDIDGKVKPRLMAFFESSFIANIEVGN